MGTVRRDMLLGLIVFLLALLTIEKARFFNRNELKAAGSRAETLGLSAECNPETFDKERRAWLEGYLDARAKRMERAGIVSERGE